MVDAALDGEYDIEESVYYNSDRASVLFEMYDCLSSEEPYLQSPGKALNYLINKDYDLEKRNDGGLTPLFHAVASFRPQSIKCIRTFIRREADIHVIDPGGHGALHLALNGPYTLHKWGTQSHLRPAGANITDNLWDLKTVRQTEDDGLAGCSSDQEGQREVLSYCGRRQYQGYVLTNPPLELENALPIVDDLSPVSILGALRKDEEEKPRSDKDMSDYISCKDYDVDRWIRRPMEVLKTRLRVVLLTLLRTGCDPNVLDYQNAPPSAYARQYNLWPQWSWALKEAGYGYDMRQDRWVKNHDLS